MSLMGGIQNTGASPVNRSGENRYENVSRGALTKSGTAILGMASKFRTTNVLSAQPGKTSIASQTNTPSYLTNLKIKDRADVVMNSFHVRNVVSNCLDNSNENRVAVDTQVKTLSQHLFNEYATFNATVFPTTDLLDSDLVKAVMLQTLEYCAEVKLLAQNSRELFTGVESKYSYDDAFYTKHGGEKTEDPHLSHAKAIIQFFDKGASFKPRADEALNKEFVRIWNDVKTEWFKTLSPSEQTMMKELGLTVSPEASVATQTTPPTTRVIASPITDTELDSRSDTIIGLIAKEMVYPIGSPTLELEVADGEGGEVAVLVHLYTNDRWSTQRCNIPLETSELLKLKADKNDHYSNTFLTKLQDRLFVDWNKANVAAIKIKLSEQRASTLTPVVEAAPSITEAERELLLNELINQIATEWKELGDKKKLSDTRDAKSEIVAGEHGKVIVKVQGANFTHMFPISSETSEPLKLAADNNNSYSNTFLKKLAERLFVDWRKANVVAVNLQRRR